MEQLKESVSAFVNFEWNKTTGQHPEAHYVQWLLGLTDYMGGL